MCRHTTASPIREGKLWGLQHEDHKGTNEELDGGRERNTHSRCFLGEVDPGGEQPERSLLARNLRTSRHTEPQTNEKNKVLHSVFPRVKSRKHRYPPEQRNSGTAGSGTIVQSRPAHQKGDTTSTLPTRSCGPSLKRRGGQGQVQRTSTGQLEFLSSGLGWGGQDARTPRTAGGGPPFGATKKKSRRQNLNNYCFSGEAIGTVAHPLAARLAERKREPGKHQKPTSR